MKAVAVDMDLWHSSSQMVEVLVLKWVVVWVVVPLAIGMVELTIGAGA